MAGSVSEQISEVVADLLLRSVGDLAQIIQNAGMMLTSVGNEALAELIRKVDKDKLPKESAKALDKIQKAVEKDGAVPRQVTILESDRDYVENLLKKQDVLFAAVRNDNQEAVAGFEKCAIVFLEQDAQAVQNALVLLQREKGLINELTPGAFLLAHKRKDIAVMDNLDAYELAVFREVAKEHGLVYAAMLTPDDLKKAGDEPTYKIMVVKQDAVTCAAALQMVSWAMTGEHKKDIMQKIKERTSIKQEIQNLVRTGVKKGEVSVEAKFGQRTTVENAKYIVNRNAPHQYIKMTAEGFAHFKFGKEVARVSKGDPTYDNEIQLALGEFSDAVLFDAAEWEQEGFEKANVRKKAVKEKASVFPKKFDKHKEAEELQKARKHRKEHEPLEETAWLFDRYDTARPFSEVYEVNYNNLSEPPEKTVSVHYGEARAQAEKYVYIDVSSDAKSLDNIISKAKERTSGQEYEAPEREESLS